MKVEPESDEFRIEAGRHPKIFLENPAENGRANSELLRRLEEVLGERPGIVSGHSSRRKKIAVDLPEEVVENRLEEETRG